MNYVCDIELRPGDRVVVRAIGPLMNCRALEKTIDFIDKETDRVHFTDGTTYNYEENQGMTIDLIGERRPKILKLA